MKVIKHGNTIKEMTCPSCFCIFEYSGKDIVLHGTKIYDRDIGLMVTCPYNTINCPECGENIALRESDINE